MTAPAWESVDAREFLRDVEKARTEVYKPQPHQFKPRKRIPWVVCQTCGLVSLRNKRTEWCMKMGCMYQSHPEYKRRISAPSSL